MDTISEDVFKTDEEAERGNEVDYNSNNYYLISFYCNSHQRQKS